MDERVDTSLNGGGWGSGGFGFKLKVLLDACFVDVGVEVEDV